MQLARSYSDKVYYNENVIEVAWRRGSVEVNTASSSVEGRRFYSDGSWVVVSVQGVGENLERLEKSLVKIKRGGKGFLVLGDYCSGSWRTGSMSDIDSIVELVDYIAKNIGGGEVIVLAENTVMEIVNDYTRCREEKTVYEIEVYAEKHDGIHYAIGSAGVAFTGSLKDAWRIVDELVEEALRKLKANLNAQKLSVLDSGKWTLILGYEASGAFFHELAHLLEGDQPGSLPVGTRISTTSITVYDDPYYPWSPTRRMFDDEAVESVRKPLVEDGEIVDHLHTRESAAKTILDGREARPGQARGLFHKPKAMHSTLVVAGGDWRVRELVEETRKGLLIDGIIRAELRGQTVTIYPEAAWLVEKEIEKPVKLRLIRLPLLKALITIDAMTRTSRLRHSFEKGHRVAEIAPMIRLQGVVEA